MQIHHSQNSPSTRRAAFTLIEILVVIAIIALLAAILFPVFSRARESARTKTCASNLRQIGLAFQQYTQDSGRRYPGAGQFQKWGNGGHWVSGSNGNRLAELSGDFEPTGNSADIEGGALYNYVKSTQVYVCPSNADGEVKRLTYSMNCALAGIHDVRITQASEIVLLVDEDKNNDGYWFADDVRGSTDKIATFHNNGGNLLFADGHVKFYPYNVFPLDSSTEGLKNKARYEGTPRFYDRSFGTKNFWEGSAAAFGTCESP